MVNEHALGTSNTGSDTFSFGNGEANTNTTGLLEANKFDFGAQSTDAALFEATTTQASAFGTNTPIFFFGTNTQKEHNEPDTSGLGAPASSTGTQEPQQTTAPNRRTARRSKPQQTTAPTSGAKPQQSTAPTFGSSSPGASVTQQVTGTAHVKYNPVEGTDVMVKNGSSQNVNVKHHCITCMKEYESKSLEELRLEDYVAGRKKAQVKGVFGGFRQTENKPLLRAPNFLFGSTANTNTTGLFGSAPSTSTGLFGQQNTTLGGGGLFGNTRNGFVTQQATGTAHAKFNPVVGTELVGKLGYLNIKHHCITCMKEYESKSLEELRLEDYVAGRKKAQVKGVFGGFRQTENKPLLRAPNFAFGSTANTNTTGLFGSAPSTSTGLFGQQNTTLGGGSLFGNTRSASVTQQVTGTDHIKYNPVVGTDVVVKSGSPHYVNIKHHCITCMKEYGSKSLEELRLEDYVAGRKKAQVKGVFGGFRQTENKPLLRAPTSSTTPHNTLPLRFHAVHGKSVSIFSDGTVARNVVSNRNGVAFSTRPVRIYEKVCFRLHEISDRSAIFFGFTPCDPLTLTHELTLDTIRFINKPRNYYRFLDRKFCKKDNILSYYFDSAGKVHFEINWCHKGVLLSSVDANSSLWAFVILEYTALQFIDPEEPQQVSGSTLNPYEEESLVTDTGSLLAEDVLPSPRYPDPLEPLSLHRTKGCNVQFVNEVAERIGAEFCQGYVFTALPMRLGQTIVVQILATELLFMGSLAIGLTSCDPATIRPCDLPSDATELLDRPEYWVVTRNAADGLRRGDEVAVTLTIDGEVQVCVNGSDTVTVMHVDCTVRLWAFVDIYGATRKVRLLSTKATRAETPPRQLRDVASSTTLTPASTCETVTSLSQIDASNAANRHYIEPTEALSQLSLNINQAISLWLSTSLALESNRPRTEDHHSSTSYKNSNQWFQMPIRSAERLRLNRIPEPSTSLQIPSTSRHNPLKVEENLTNPECLLCFENPIDCVVYNCGHMCMCYSCGVKQWKKTGNGQCPICRELIIDIIRTYKS